MVDIRGRTKPELNAVLPTRVKYAEIILTRSQQNFLILFSDLGHDAIQAADRLIFIPGT